MASDLGGAKVKARSLFDTLNMPQNPDGLRILDQDEHQVYFWTPETDESQATTLSLLRPYRTHVHEVKINIYSS